VIVVLALCSTFLVWKGALPSHAFFTILGAGVVWAVPRAASLFGRQEGILPEPRSRRAARVDDDADLLKPSPPFGAEEIPTKRDLRGDALTVPRKLDKRKIFGPKDPKD
jgi:hypothetical protein